MGINFTLHSVNEKGQEKDVHERRQDGIHDNNSLVFIKKYAILVLTNAIFFILITLPVISFYSAVCCDGWMWAVR